MQILERAALASSGTSWYRNPMTNVAKEPEITAVPLTEDVAAMSEYVRSPNGRAAIRKGLDDIRAGRVVEGRGALAAELSRRAEARRRT